MNLIVAWVFFTAAAGIGVPRAADSAAKSTAPVSILEVTPGSPAGKAGLKFGDQIIEMRARDVSLRIESERDVRDFADAYRGENITLVVRRQEEILSLRAVPRTSYPAGEGPLGVSLGKIMMYRSPWYLAPAEGLWSVGMSIIGIVSGLGSVLWNLVARHGAEVAVSGPVGIFLFAADSRALGAAYFLQFVGVLSVNLAILNILPIPALDGGRVFFLVIEKIRGRKVNPRTEDRTHLIGFAILILLMALVTWRDVAHLL